MLPGAVAYIITSGPDSLFSFPVVEGKQQFDAALPLLVVHVLPAGLKGLVVAGLLAALMSSLSSVFNSCSTPVTIDIYKKFRPQSSESRLVIAGQLATVVLVILGLAWIPMLNLIEGGLFQKLQSIQAYIAPSIAAVFLLGLFMKRLNYFGAMATLIFGAVLGVFRLILELNKTHLSGFLYYFSDINFLHFALLLFVLCSIVLIAVSYFRPMMESRDFKLVTYSKSKTAFNSFNVGLSIGLVILVLCLWIFFA
jgi:SSS family solute:Na+ symporter